MRKEADGVGSAESPARRVCLASLTLSMYCAFLSKFISPSATSHSSKKPMLLF